MLETCRISSLALYGGSGDRYGSLPIDFRVVVVRYYWKMVCVFEHIPEALRNGSIKKNIKKRGNWGEPSKDRNEKDDNKRTKTGNDLATTANPVRREYTGMTPKVVHRNVNPINARNPPARACYECGSTNHVNGACPRLNQTQRLRGNNQNKVLTVNGVQDHGNNGMDWLSNHKAEIICHEKVVRVPLPDGKVLKVIGERPKEKMRHLRSTKTKEQKQEEIMVVRDYPEVLSDDLLGLSPI
nr:putative reverse transcriptase domain-containing protein [Tanacetum cinerariifolium]